MRKPRMLAAAALSAVGLIVAGVGMASARPAYPPNTIVARGLDSFVADVSVQSSLHYEPSNLSIQSGGTLTVNNLSQTDGHTFSLVEQSQQPQHFNQATSGCFNPSRACAQIIASHFPPGQPPVFFVDADGDGGFDVPGDSEILKVRGSFSVTITAPAGTTLYFMCAFHPWMQGSINVT